MGLMGAARLRDWESTFAGWAGPPGQTEQERCDRAQDAVKKAIADSHALAGLSTRTFAQGSYANRTNVRADSDVDVCALCDVPFFYHLPTGLTLQSINCIPASYTYAQYKSEVEAALAAHFGRANVVRGNKAFDIHENSYRVDADAVACFGYRHYYYDSLGQLRYVSGTALLTDRAQLLVTNFPQWQYDNGVAKNEATGRRFKALVRIIKRLRNEMEAQGYAVARQMASFLIESLVWNWPPELFSTLPSWAGTTRAFLVWLWGGTRTDAECATWMEENGIKQLFGPHNEWTREQANSFALAAYTYIDNR